MKRINVNFDWQYSENFDESMLAADAQEKGFVKVNIPHANKEIPYNNFDEEMYQFVSCYRKHIVIPKSLKGKKLILTFEAVANAADVYVNGQFAFSHKGSYTAFGGDIAPFVKYDEDNVIAVKVDSTERPDIPPFGGVVDYLVYGGIYREVYIYVHENVYVTKLHLTPKDVLTEEPKLSAKAYFNQSAEGKEIVFSLKDPDGKEIANQTLVADGESAEATFIVKNARLWDLDNPNLYTVDVKFNKETYSERTGIRECKFKKRGFYLNGKRIKIVGLNRHQSYPYVGYAMPKSAQEADAILLKEKLGVNLARTSHYPNSKHFLNKCDEIGLLVFTEIPGWQFVSKEQEWRDMCIQHINEMISEDYNHPSIILWGVRINESGDDDELYKRTNALAHSLDSTRQTGGVRCIPRSHLLEDVYTYNDFTHSGGKMVLAPKWFVCGNKPYLVTEHNGHMFPTKTFDHEKKRQEHALRHARVIDKMYSDNTRCGCIGWCMSDYNTHKDFGSGDKICYHGVTDMFRADKLAANVYKMQQKKIPVLEISSNMEIGDNAGGQVGDVYIFTNCDKIVMYKNGVAINTFDMEKERKASKNFKHMPMPPVPLYDVIGDQLEKDTTYKFSKRYCNKLKKALLDVKKYGTIGGILRHIPTLLTGLTRYHLSVDSITMMFGKFVTSWGGKQVSYKFEGYMGDEKVITVEKGSVFTPSLYAAADSTELEEKDTYDVTRVEIKSVSQYGNVLPYDNSVVEIKTNGIVDLIGPKTVAMIGGQRAFWIKTNGKEGKAVVTLTSDTLGKKVLEFDVKKTAID